MLPQLLCSASCHRQVRSAKASSVPIRGYILIFVDRHQDAIIQHGERGTGAPIQGLRDAVLLTISSAIYTYAEFGIALRYIEGWRS